MDSNYTYHKDNLNDEIVRWKKKKRALEKKEESTDHYLKVKRIKYQKPTNE
jgi:hypothetical protein